MSEQNPTPRGTSAHAPDLNWSQVRETVLMLELAALQIETAMKDSDASVDVLAGSFTTMAGMLRTLSDTAARLPLDGEVGAARAELESLSGQVASMVNQAIVAFQFYDKLVQRLAHVGLSLGQLSELVSDPRRLFNPGEWVGLQQHIRAKYTTREEIAMFEAVMQGVPVQQAIDHYLAELRDHGDDIELF